MSVVQEFLAFDEQRKYPRLKVDLPMKIGWQSGRKFNARIYDLSPDGIQIHCDEATAEMICPVNKSIGEGDIKPVVTITFNIPNPDGEKEIVVKSQICHICALDYLPAGMIAIGSRFVDFKDQCENYVTQYLLSEMEPAY